MIYLELLFKPNYAADGTPPGIPVNKFRILSLNFNNVTEGQPVFVGPHPFESSRGLVIPQKICTQTEAIIQLVLISDGKGGKTEIAYAACSGCRKNWY